MNSKQSCVCEDTYLYIWLRILRSVLKNSGTSLIFIARFLDLLKDLLLNSLPKVVEKDDENLLMKES